MPATIRPIGKFKLPSDWKFKWLLMDSLPKSRALD